MATKTKVETVTKEVTVEEKLKSLYQLQEVSSRIDKIRILRGELPLEVQDLEDEIAGLQTRLENLTNDINSCETQISAKRVAIEESRMKIARYTDQQNNVSNSREYDNLVKEINFENLEIELSEKHIRELNAKLQSRQEEKQQTISDIEERKLDLSQKKSELSEIVAETRQEEESLREQAKQIEGEIEDRLLSAFKRIRKNARNGLAVVTVQRDACGGCFNKIPPQRQLDIRQRKKVIVCEYCGRILVDADLANEVNGVPAPVVEEPVEAAPKKKTTKKAAKKEEPAAE